MTGLLELREKLKMIYSRNETFILPIVKFLLALIVLSTVNGQLGYMARLDSLPIVLIVSLLCSFLPNGCIVLFAALFSLLHMYELSMEVAGVGLCVYLVMTLLFMRFAPKGSLLVVITPLLFVMKIPYVIPIVVGLLGTPASAVPVACGVVVYYFLSNVAANATVIGGMGAEEATAKLRMVIDALIGNKTMIVMVAAFVITIIVVYLLRRLSVDYAWTIAMVAGGILDLVILLIGDLMYDTNMSVVEAILGTVLALVVAKILEFFRFCVDYSRTEKVQFEDDEYYYYVKAVPKMTVAAQTKTVKKINAQRKNGTASQRSQEAGPREEGGSYRNGGYQGQNGNHRNVTTERTPVNRNGAGAEYEGGRNTRVYRNEHVNGRSVSINSSMVEDDRQDEYYEDYDE